MAAKVPILVAAIVLVALAGGAGVFTFGRDRRPTVVSAGKLVGDDFGRMRRDALELFPRGLPIGDALDGLTKLGFRCAPARHMMSNINAPSVECDSAGRGYPTASRVQITVMARNGVLSDVAVGNGFDSFQADARTPYPNSTGKSVAAGPE